MNRTTTAPLRASCERCRAQKLRFIPSTETDSGAPCQRCVRTKVSESCVFSSRSKTGRTGRCRKLSGNAESPPQVSSKDKDASMPVLLGMSTFALSGSFSSSPEAVTLDPLGLLSEKNSPPMLSLDDNTVAVDCAPEGSMSDFWQHDTGVLDKFSLDDFLQQPSNFLSGSNQSAFMDDNSA
ncbi:hypothetical protein K432DRAFT_409989 [Lepidopterella palustris CBS 459.81]|uniref:Zn(2)-C6 fungal-type domain-containing protein n=1 Tax=Lepidopterella palustris CBS 459.81 TaxID=1314670 RepID=A0A8E2DZ39_9PEZI|nr:hypothetical protein K432DRAFT_409989 [Lepidopterella palustris CBS 459.81]